jgi:hypothetical protein
MTIPDEKISNLTNLILVKHWSTKFGFELLVIISKGVDGKL